MDTGSKLRWVLTLAMVLATTAMSVVPGHSRYGNSILIRLVEMTPTVMQKIMHFLVYAGLALLWVWALEGICSRYLRMVIALLVCVGLGAGLEWYQSRVPGRFGAISDVFLNAVGVLAGLLMAQAILFSENF
jgi:VanZ family protein